MSNGLLGRHACTSYACTSYAPPLPLVCCCQQAEGTVNVRTRDNVVHGMRPLAEVKQLLAQERDSRSLTSAFGSKHEDGSSEQQQEGKQEAAPAADS